MEPIELLKDRGRRLVVTPKGPEGRSSVYLVTRHQAAELAGLPGVDVQRIRAELETKQDAEFRLEACRSDEERARVQAELEASKTRLRKQLVDEVAGTQERALAYLARCRSMICSSVVAIGIAKPDAEPGPRLPGTRPTDVCEPITEGPDPILLRPLTFTLERTTRPDALCILEALEQIETVTLATLIAAAFTVRPLVTPLPREPRAAPVG